MIQSFTMRLIEIFSSDSFSSFLLLVLLFVSPSNLTVALKTKLIKREKEENESLTFSLDRSFRSL